MGKTEDEQSLPSTTVDAQGTTPNLSWSKIKKCVNFRCVFVSVLGIAVILSAVFWLPFFHFGNKKDLDQDLEYGGHNIVASFMLNKPASFLEDHVLQLEDDIFDEMRFSTTKVRIIALEESSDGSNITNVVFSVESDATSQSLIRASFVSLITRQSLLRLNESLFGNPFSFEVLKFRGGITASPDQKAFLMQSVQIRFNFTLNFSMDQILNNFDELSTQLKTGLQLAPYENLYIKLTNLKGSTISPPITVQSQILLAVGINPSELRQKQLAQTIGSHSKNLGLNNTVFGRVKQVRLSSILQHSPSPSPTPLPPPLRHRHHHHHRQVSGHAPIISPSPSVGSGAPATGNNKAPNCSFGRFPWTHDKNSHVSPPVYAPSQPKKMDHLTPKKSPVPTISPLPNVPSKGGFNARSPDVMPFVSPSPSPSSAGIFSSTLWALPLFTILLLPVLNF